MKFCATVGVSACGGGGVGGQGQYIKCTVREYMCTSNTNVYEVPFYVAVKLFSLLPAVRDFPVLLHECYVTLPLICSICIA
jgi:hypothetical protein